jgi:outer membrane protein OmpA-like peptidoglycan-associated protein
MLRLARLVLAVILTAPGLATAQGNPLARRFDLVPNKPTAAQESGITLESATPAAEKSLGLSMLFDWNVGILALVMQEQKLGDVVPYRVDLHLLAAYQLHPRVEFGVDLPVALAQGDNFSLLNQYGYSEPGVSGGLGDIRLLPRLILFPAQESPIGVALITEVRLPTGSGQNFLGESAPVFAPRIALERPFGPFRLLGNFGARLRKETQYINLIVGSEYTFSLGGMYRLPDLGRFFDINAMAEMNLATPTAAPFALAEFADQRKSAWEVLFGLRSKFAERWGAELAIGRGIAVHSGYAREAFRGIASVRYDFDLAARRPVMLADSDGDGIPDSEDACPNQPGLPEFDGCPDTDGDQVPDNVDKCPNEPGPASNFGCPVGPPFVVLEAGQIQLRGSVVFDLGQATVHKQSFPLLDEVAGVLKTRSEIELMEVEGHTDNRGGRAYNQDLSERRAKAVVDYLAKKGVQVRRLQSRGFAFDRPVASNDDALGRAKNRRVEFHILKSAAQTASRPASEAPKASTTATQH